jgi:hypothetical protein
MSTTHIPAEMRREVTLRARHLCEYCLIHADDTYWGCQIDHIISEKHGGATTVDNLAHACTFCNRNKGSDVGSLLAAKNPQERQFVRFFNPRIDRWSDHFRLDGIGITPLTNIGKVTANILGFNSIDRLLERQELQALGRYPSPTAQRVMNE